MGPTGGLLPEAEVVPGMSVTFDVGPDETRTASGAPSGKVMVMMPFPLSLRALSLVPSNDHRARPSPRAPLPQFTHSFRFVHTSFPHLSLPAPPPHACPQVKAIRVQKVDDAAAPPAGAPQVLPGADVARLAVAQRGGYVFPGPTGERTLSDPSPEGVTMRAASVAAASGGIIALVKPNVRGTVLRDAKKDAPGIIKLTAQPSMKFPLEVKRTRTCWTPSHISPLPLSHLLPRPFFDVYQVTHPDVLDAVCEFRDLAEVQEVVLDLLPPSTRKVWYACRDR